MKDKRAHCNIDTFIQQNSNYELQKIKEIQMDDTEKLKALVKLIGSHENYSCNGNIEKIPLPHRRIFLFNKFHRYFVYDL